MTQAIDEQSRDGLLACPWCGTTEYLSLSKCGSLTGDMPDRPYRGVCNHIDHDQVQGPVAYGRFDAIKAWNSRVSRPSLEPSAVSFELVWNAAARPPVHPDKMRGEQSFASAEEAMDRFRGLAGDAEFVSLTKVTTFREEAAAALQHGEGSLEPTLGSHTEGVSGADPALAVPAKPISRLGASRCDQGESKCEATCLNCAGSGQMAVMTGTRRDLIAYYTPCPNGPAPDVAKAAWGLINAVEGGDSIPRACGILRWALVAESNNGVLDALRSISSQLGAGLADNVTDPMKLIARIQWGVDHIQSVEAQRAADLIGELSAKPQTTWGAGADSRP